ncbi:hypothetical protein [Fibrella aquatilis]|uniref:Uncharacterized protein n=1 Tax=Fibrella aquatilis TaxID=2817059 RepID=A0A939G693_9BACT|nr:hypothetical protein [Fibrella aquatilis]MBO0931170.1 hypothetical protein [Fibrella aquatilis]
MLTTSRPATRTRNPAKAGIWKQRIIKYFDLLSPEDQEDIKKFIENRPLVVDTASENTSATTIQPPDIFFDYTDEYAAIQARKSSISQWHFPEDRVWHLQALVGDSIVYEAMQENNGQLTGSMVLELIQARPIPLYINKRMDCLSMGTTELMERDFGPLDPIDPIDAVQRFGLAKLEEASERSYARI